MTAPRPVAIVGAGKLGDLLLDCLDGDPRYEVVAFLDDGRAGGSLAGVPILSPDEAALAPGTAAFLAIGFPAERRAMRLRCAGLELDWQGFVDRRAMVSSRATLGRGTLVLSFAMIAATATIGEFVYVSSYARIGAHSIVGDYASLLSGSAAGGSTIGADCVVGTNSSCLDGATIGEGATIAPHVFVRGAVPPGALVAGPAARILRQPGEAAMSDDG